MGVEVIVIMSDLENNFIFDHPTGDKQSNYEDKQGVDYINGKQIFDQITRWQALGRQQVPQLDSPHRLLIRIRIGI